MGIARTADVCLSGDEMQLQTFTAQSAGLLYLGDHRLIALPDVHLLFPAHQFPREVMSFWQGAESEGFFDLRQLRRASALAMLKKQYLIASARHIDCSSAVRSRDGCCAAAWPMKDCANAHIARQIGAARIV
jgi:hypothetical protein